MSRRSRRAAWGSLSEVSPGVWRIRYWSEGADGYRRRSETVRGSRKDAERRRSELMLLHGEDAPCPTVRQAWERWALPAYERRLESGDLAANTMNQYRSAWNAHVSPRWADVPCDEVRPLKVQQWIDQLTLGQARAATKLLTAILDYAVRYEHLDHNPMREKYLMPSKSTVERRDAGIWTLPELMGVWESVRGEWYEPAFLLAAFGGLRVGESMGVKGADVTSRTINGTPVCAVDVVRQVANRGGVDERMKTGGSARVAVVVGPPALRLEAMRADLPPDWFLTHYGDGSPSKQVTLGRSWRQAHPFRNLRNSWETWMRYDLRAPRWLIERLMGHVAGDVSDAYYDRPDAARLCEVMADLYAERPVLGTI